jgi:hypothetical protein
MVAAADALYRGRWGRATWALQAGVAAHAYTVREDRISRSGAARLDLPLSARMTAGISATATRRGTSSARSVNDQLTITPRVGYRFGRGGLARASGGIALGRSRAGQDAGASRHLGLFLRTGTPRRPHALLATRYERRRGERPRDHYGRWLHQLEYVVPLDPATSVGGWLQYVEQDYPHRRLAPAAGVRRDHTWRPGMRVTREVGEALALGLSYEFNERASSDPDWGYRAHVVRFVTRYRW